MSPLRALIANLSLRLRAAAGFYFGTFYFGFRYAG
jgi:hypothetical protein